MPEARIEPITDTPIVPPMVRKNWAALVAAPRWRLGTPFCTASERFWISRPSPRPVTIIATVACSAAEPTPMVASSRKPAPMTTGPATSAQR